MLYPSDTRTNCQYYAVAIVKQSNREYSLQLLRGDRGDVDTGTALLLAHTPISLVDGARYSLSIAFQDSKHFVIALDRATKIIYTDTTRAWNVFTQNANSGYLALYHCGSNSIVTPFSLHVSGKPQTVAPLDMNSDCPSPMRRRRLLGLATTNASWASSSVNNATPTTSTMMSTQWHTVNTQNGNNASMTTTTAERSQMPFLLQRIEIIIAISVFVFCLLAILVAMSIRLCRTRSTFAGSPVGSLSSHTAQIYQKQNTVQLPHVHAQKIEAEDSAVSKSSNVPLPDFAEEEEEEEDEDDDDEQRAQTKELFVKSYASGYVSGNSAHSMGSSLISFMTKHSNRGIGVELVNGSLFGSRSNNTHGLQSRTPISSHVDVDYGVYLT